MSSIRCPNCNGIDIISAKESAKASVSGIMGIIWFIAGFFSAGGGWLIWLILAIVYWNTDKDELNCNTCRYKWINR